MSPRGRRLLWSLIAAGAIARLVAAFAFYGATFDIRTLDVLAEVFVDDPWDIYEPPGMSPFPLWTYPPGALAFVLPAAWVGDATGLPFHGLVQLPSIAADAGIAWLVQAELGRRGRPERDRLLGAALVALGPSFAVISGYHGQIDSVAMLPALLGLLVWTRSGDPSRAWKAGLLIGLAAAIKVPPLVVAGALLPTARSWREGGTLLVAAAAVPLATLAPFLLEDPGTTLDALDYEGLPGLGGLSLVAQPELARNWLLDEMRPLSGVSEVLQDGGGLLLAAGLLATLVVLVERRVRPAESAAVLYLVVWVLGVNFAFQYAVWGLPFLLVAGRLREAAALQALWLVPAFLYYAGPHDSAPLADAYTVLMIAAWVALAGVLMLVLRRRVAA